MTEADRGSLQGCQGTKQPQSLMQEEEDKKEHKLGNAWAGIHGDILPVLLNFREATAD